MRAPLVERSGRLDGPPAGTRRVLRPAVFIDKDGTLVENVPYNVDPARLRFMPQAGRVLRRLADAGFALVVVSNQSGIARGLFTAADLLRLEAALRLRLLEAHGVDLDAMLSCPHLPDARGAPACACRKPAPGLLLQAAALLALDLRRSWMIGDTLDDVEAGHRAGCRALLFDSGGETLWRAGPLREPQQRVTHWSTAGALILADARGWR
ncbi:HAD-IIIA family hydrolase [Pelomonas sp. APW6]|uniref:D,D-heptose 1,7-bisphosphate phosphatase n=1 Tax=Roseateles subflavus TaxID=3053353 RepID=A0ABT7LPZ8_9BURK|nr:HAD-IIIA family hydrolase [Pelomonas sp. APW6]MDL5033810.1 HAD-IIIA family hydrolase [Pelomonas sp. APW6]